MTAWMTLVAVALSASVAHADPGQFDDLMRPDSMAQPLDMRPRTDHQIDMLATVGHRHDRLWRAIDATTLAVSMAALACDWGQTHRAASEHWTGGMNGTGRHEGNQIMGPAPSTRVVNMYFVTSAALNVALWYALPRRYRSIVPAVVATAETIQVSNNIGSVSLCGL